MIVLIEKNDNNEINVLETLMTIREDIASINTKLDDMGNVDKRIVVSCTPNFCFLS